MKIKFYNTIPKKDDLYPYWDITLIPSIGFTYMGFKDESYQVKKSLDVHMSWLFWNITITIL